MANKKVSQLTSKPSVLSTDIVPIADPTSGQLFKTTLSALGAVIGSAVASVNGLIGVVVLDTDDIQELASPTNRWYTDTRSRAALSGGTGISYNSGTGVITNAVTSGQVIAGLGYTPANDSEVVKLTGSQTIGGVKTFSSNVVSNGFVKIGGTSGQFLMADGSVSTGFSFTYPSAGIAVSTGSAWGTSVVNNSSNWNTAFSWGNHAGLYLPIGGGTLTGALSGTSASFSGNVTANSFIKSGGTSSQFLKADGSVDVRSFATTGNLADYLPLTGGALLNNPSSAYVLTVTNNSTASGANGLNVSIATGSTGMPFKVDKGGVSLFTIDNLGASVLKSTITAISFIKSSGTSSEYLMADGSVSTGPSFTYPGAGIVVSTGSAWGTSITNNSSNWNTAFSWGNHAGLYLPIGGGTLTGALSGTSATFSGQVNAASKHTWGSATNGTTGQIATDGTNNYFDYVGSLIFRGASASNTLVTFTNAGAATFSSSVGINSGDFRLRPNGDVTNSPALVLKSPTAGVLSLCAEVVGDANANSNSLSLRVSNPDRGRFDALTILPAGNVGIGTTSPNTALDVNGTINVRTNGFEFGRITTNNISGNQGGLSFQYNVSGTFTEGMRINAAGNVGIGTTAPSNTLDVSGTIRATSSITATSFFESSDKTIKTLIEDNYQTKGIESVTAKLYLKNGVEELGYFAQDVQAILPSAVSKGADGLLSLSYREVHTAKIARLEKEVEELKAQLNLV